MAFDSLVVIALKYRSVQYLTESSGRLDVLAFGLATASQYSYRL